MGRLIIIVVFSSNILQTHRLEREIRFFAIVKGFCFILILLIFFQKTDVSDDSL